MTLSIIGSYRNILFPHLLLKIAVYSIQELLSIQIVFTMVNLIAMNTNGEVLRHFAFFNGFNAYGLQCIAKINQGLVIIQFSTEGQTPGPCKD